MEHIIVNQMRDLLDEHHILVSDLVIPEKSQLIITVHDLTSSLNQRKQIGTAILDFSKAFNRVPHTRLKAKLNHNGIRGNTQIDCNL